MRSALALILTGTAAVIMTTMTSGNVAAQSDTRPPEASCATAAKKWMAGANYKAGDTVISYGGFLWACKDGAATALCDEPGYEPDRNKRATEAWELRYDPEKESSQCDTVFAPDLFVEKVEVSSVTCKGTLATVKLTATVINNSPAGGDTTVAFYHGAKKTLIKAEPIFLEEVNYDPILISTTWTTSTLGGDAGTAGAVSSALITVVADDDGTGRDRYFEFNPDDNIRAVVLSTCAVPKPGPIQP